MIDAYDFAHIEAKWQRAWEDQRAFEAVEDPSKPKFYCLEMYPYPSGRIHMGHVRNYSIGDVIARQKLMAGCSVLHPIGWDALGMPAENAAIKNGTHPRTWTLDNVDHMRVQLKRMGFSYDWSREVNTCLPDYYKWNQWIFLRMLEKGLAFRKESWVNWCPQCQTVLANEQVVGGGCWRCETPVAQKKMEQWFLKITAYADELLTGHDQLAKWPEHVLQMQKNWIGRSTGAHVHFGLAGTGKTIEVFTTRLDTIYGATFLVVSAEHPIVPDLVAGPKEKELGAWVARTVAEMRKRRDIGETEKDGVDTGKKAVNPFTGELVPVWMANYVLMDYGTGAIMAVPAHDARDFEFAKSYGIPIRTVIAPEDKAGGSFDAEPVEVFEDVGVLVNSGPFSGLPSAKAMDEMGKYAEDKGIGRRSTVFRLRDWGISRQRYWGTPIPVIYCATCGIVGVPDRDLPVELPFDVKLTGEEGSPLERHESFVKTTCPKCHGPARRETDTMDTFVDSSWYFFRYCSPKDADLPFRPEAAKHWLPVDLYIGGVEHAILHLIYSRFFTKVLRDFGLTGISEPFPRYLAQGMVTKDGSAMSKSKGNIVDPDDILKSYGADTLRLFILFASPPDREFAWDESGLDGCYRFLVRVWTIVHENIDVFADRVRRRSRPGLRRGRRVPGGQENAPDDPQGDRGHRRPFPSQHGHQLDHGALQPGQEGAGRTEGNPGRPGRPAPGPGIHHPAPFAAHAAHRRRALGEDRPPGAPHALALARLRPRAGPGRDGHHHRPGQRQAPGQVRGGARPAGARARGAALALPKIQAALGGKPPRKIISVKNKLVNIVS